MNPDIKHQQECVKHADEFLDGRSREEFNIALGATFMDAYRHTRSQVNDLKEELRSAQYEINELKYRLGEACDYGCLPKDGWARCPEHGLLPKR